MRTISRPKIIGAISPPPYAQSSPPKPDVEGAQSPPAAHRDDSLATNPSAGLVTESHPPSRRRGGWGRAGVLAVVACLAWLAWPTAAFAQVTAMAVDVIAGNGEVDALEKWNGFYITGNTGNLSGVVTVTVTTDSGGFTTTTVLGTTTSAKVGDATMATWSVRVPENSSLITVTETGDDDPYVEASSPHQNSVL